MVLNIHQSNGGPRRANCTE
jgi:hypothetical protein